MLLKLGRVMVIGPQQICHRRIIRVMLQDFQPVPLQLFDQSAFGIDQFHIGMDILMLLSSQAGLNMQTVRHGRWLTGLINVPSLNGNRQRCILRNQQGCRLQQGIPLEWIAQHESALFGICKRLFTRVHTDSGGAQQYHSGTVPPAFEMMHPVDSLKARPLKQQPVSVEVRRPNIQQLLFVGQRMDGSIIGRTQNEGG